MSEIFDEYRKKAEACRRLVELSEDDQRKVLWSERAIEWERLAAKAEKQ